MPRRKKIDTKKVEKEIKKTVAKAEEKAKEVVEDLGEEVGKITHYFDKVGVAVVELAKDLVEGAEIRIKGVTTDFIQKIESMQIEHKTVKKARKGESVGLKVKEKVRPHDKVYVAK